MSGLRPHPAVRTRRFLRTSVRWHESLFGFTFGRDDTTFDTRDSAPFEACLDLCDIYADDRSDEKGDWNAALPIRHAKAVPA